MFLFKTHVCITLLLILGTSSPHFSSSPLPKDMKTVYNAELHIYTKEMERCAFAPSTDQCS